MSKHRLRVTTQGGQRVLIQCGWNSRKQHHFLSIEDSRYVTSYNAHDDPAGWPKDLVMFESEETGDGSMTLAQIQAKFTELGIDPPPPLLIHLKVEEEKNIDGYHRYWVTGKVFNHEADYHTTLSSTESDWRLLGEDTPQTITLQSSRDLANPDIQQRLKEINIRYGNDVEVYGPSVIGANVTLGDEVLFQGSVSVGIGSHIGAGVILNEGCMVGQKVHIGEWTEVDKGVRIEDGVRIGHNCWIQRQAYIEQETTIGAKTCINKGERVQARAVVAGGCGWTTASE